MYTLKEAERFTGADAREVNRWLFGYRFKGGASVPLWHTQLADMDEGAQKVIGFRDLLELRIVKAFTEHKVPLRVIRAAIVSAREIFSTEYPFTANRFLTDGKSIFYEAFKEHGEVALTDLVRRQLVFEHIIRPELYAGIEFTAGGQALRWYPVKKSEAIVLDPEISFGKPILTEYGIRTDVLAACFAVERDKKRVAALYNIPVGAVNAAMRFEAQAA
ncbi:DUF433 domain-containing protein [Massilia glaciei]|uniref:DUF433 domain-containing protein n=1 Tax=Massilia glaciei TaxID=1524097 RepID=UPI001E58F594|nr:DUF433 domain-containing protein [Massilia glaciei]